MTQPDVIRTVLKDGNYHLSLFREDEIEELRGGIFFRTTRGKETVTTKPMRLNLVK